MRIRINLAGQSALLIMIAIIYGCSKDDYIPGSNGLLKKIKNAGYIVEEISYNQNNLVSEVNSTVFYRRFHYDQNLKPDSYSSSVIPGTNHKFVDPEKTGISMYCLYEYDKKGTLTKQLNYIPKDGEDEYRSKRTFEYNDNNLISKELLFNSDNEVTQFRTYQYDSNGNVIEEDYYTYLFIPSGAGPKHLSRITYEYDSFFNPYKIFEQSGNPGIFTNRNNIIKTKTINYDPAPGIDAVSESETSYEYNFETGYPVKVINGEEFIYE
jgi:hypothetical protein